MGSRRIAMELNRQGFRRRGGYAWNAVNVGNVINNPAVAGLTSYDEDAYTKGLPSKLSFIDETYWKLKPGGDVTVLATSIEDGEPQPQVWVCSRGKGRVFASILGHFTWTFDDPLYRVLLLRGMAWTANQPLDRFGELITIGARVQEESVRCSSGPARNLRRRLCLHCVRSCLQSIFGCVHVCEESPDESVIQRKKPIDVSLEH